MQKSSILDVWLASKYAYAYGNNLNLIEISATTTLLGKNKWFWCFWTSFVWVAKQVFSTLQAVKLILLIFKSLFRIRIFTFITFSFYIHLHELLHLKNVYTSKTKFLQLYVTLLSRYCFGRHFEIIRNFENYSLTMFSSIFFSSPMF